jgi:hypothetical protein
MDADEEDLSTEQINALLDEAESRLKCQGLGPLSGTLDKSFKTPKLNPGELAKTYIHQQNGVATMDAAIKAPRIDIKGPRKVEDPIAMLLKKKEVSVNIFSFSLSSSLVMISSP